MKTIYIGYMEHLNEFLPLIDAPERTEDFQVSVSVYEKKILGNQNQVSVIWSH